MATKTRKMPSHYPALPFYGIRAISFISTSIVAGILVYFILQLKNDNFKVPWTFLVVLLAAAANFAVLIITSLIQCCTRLSPLLNLFLNVPVLIAWIVALGLFSDNIYGTLTHSCSKGNWASPDGISICSTYKAMYSFMIFAALSAVAQLVLDIRTRIAQTRSGSYKNIDKSTNDVKLEPWDSTHSVNNSIASTRTANTQPPVVINDNSHTDDPGWRPGHKYRETDDSTADLTTYAQPPPQAQGALRMDDFQSRVPNFNNTVYDHSYSDRRY